jgi:zinc transporter 1/2/3
MRLACFGHSRDQDVEHQSRNPDSSSSDYRDEPLPGNGDTHISHKPTRIPPQGLSSLHQQGSSACADLHVPGEDPPSHAREHPDTENNHSTPYSHYYDNSSAADTFDPDSYAAQLTAIAVLEFGIIFYSVFIGLTLTVAGEEFRTLYVVLVSHQFLEGLALGSRLSSIEWPRSKRSTPYLLAIGYAISTPIAIALGLGVRQSLAPGSQTTLIVNGIFGFVYSSTILLYPRICVRSINLMALMATLRLLRLARRSFPSGRWPSSCFRTSLSFRYVKRTCRTI